MGPVTERYRCRFGEEKTELLRDQGRLSQQEWRRAWCFPDPEARGDDWEETARRWAAEVKKYRLHKIVFVTGGGNDWLRAIVATNPQHFLGFAHHDPFQPGAAEELERAVIELGFKGYKIFAPALSGSLDDQRLEGLWNTAEKFRLPVLVHFGVLGGGGGVAYHPNINPLSLHDVAKGYPGINFVIPHFGCGYPKDLLHLCWVCPNVYVDTSGNNEWVRWMPYDLTLDDLFARFYRTIGPERIIYGSDSEWFPRGYAVRYFLDQIRACRHLRIPEDEIQLIFGGNALRLLAMVKGA